MASPHVAGVAALIVSQFGHMMPGALRSMLTSTATPMACPPDLSIYDFFPAVDNGAPQVCTGGPAYNSFNGHGQVDALRQRSPEPGPKRTDQREGRSGRTGPLRGAHRALTRFGGRR